MGEKYFITTINFVPDAPLPTATKKNQIFFQPHIPLGSCVCTQNSNNKMSTLAVYI